MPEFTLLQTVAAFVILSYLFKKKKKKKTKNITHTAFVQIPSSSLVPYFVCYPLLFLFSIPLVSYIQYTVSHLHNSTVSFNASSVLKFDSKLWVCLQSLRSPSPSCSMTSTLCRGRRWSLRWKYPRREPM